MKKNIIPIFYLDNIDRLKNTSDGKNTSHVSQLRLFQPRINKKFEPIVLELENGQILTLIKNPFDQLLDCGTPPKEMINRPHGCQQFFNYH